MSNPWFSPLLPLLSLSLSPPLPSPEVATFTSTQLCDAFFWALKGSLDDVPCTEWGGWNHLSPNASASDKTALREFLDRNYDSPTFGQEFPISFASFIFGARPSAPASVSQFNLRDAGTWNTIVSRLVLPVVIFYQPIVLSRFPSTAYRGLRPYYRGVVCLAALVPVFFGGCTTVFKGHLPVALPTLLYCGRLPPSWMFTCGVALWAVGAMLFLRPARCWVGILGVGGLNLVLLQLFDGTIRLVSKLCFWCLLLSVLWLTEPLWAPPTTAAEAEGTVGKGKATAMEGRTAGKKVGRRHAVNPGSIDDVVGTTYALMVEPLLIEGGALPDIKGVHEICVEYKWLGIVEGVPVMRGSKDEDEDEVMRGSKDEEDDELAAAAEYKYLGIVDGVPVMRG